MLFTSVAIGFYGTQLETAIYALKMFVSLVLVDLMGYSIFIKGKMSSVQLCCIRLVIVCQFVLIWIIIVCQEPLVP